MNRLLNRSSAKRPTTPTSDQAPGANHAVSPRGKLRRIALKAATTVVSTVIVVSVLSGADLYLHHKYGSNIWGYRGPSVSQKQPGEKRIAALGGSTTWGFGLRTGQDFPGQVQQLFAERDRTQGSAPIQSIEFGVQ